MLRCSAEYRPTATRGQMVELSSLQAPASPVSSTRLRHWELALSATGLAVAAQLRLLPLLWISIRPTATTAVSMCQARLAPVAPLPLKQAPRFCRLTLDVQAGATRFHRTCWPTEAPAGV